VALVNQRVSVFRSVSALIGLAFGFVGAATGDPGRNDLEYKVKAAYLLNFTRYVEWPSTAFPTADAPLVICVAGDDPFGSILDKIIDSRKSNGRSIEIRRYREFDERLLVCHEVFIGAAKKNDEADILKRFSGLPILTVGETDSFLKNGGGIRLLIVGDAVHFEINMAATLGGALKISSRMLPLAKAVYSERRPP
jgi:hypothetical protein